MFQQSLKNERALTKKSTLPSPNCKFDPPCRPVQGIAPMPGDHIRDPRPYCELPDGVAPPSSMV
jgi:hypothetical protein